MPQAAGSANLPISSDYDDISSPSAAQHGANTTTSNNNR